MRDLLNRFVVASFEQDSQTLLGILRSFDLDGRAEAKAGVIVAAASLLSFERSVGEQQFAKALVHLFETSAPAEPSQKAQLSKCCLSLLL